MSVTPINPAILALAQKALENLQKEWGEQGIVKTPTTKDIVKEMERLAAQAPEQQVVQSQKEITIIPKETTYQLDDIVATQKKDEPCISRSREEVEKLYATREEAIAYGRIRLESTLSKEKASRVQVDAKYLPPTDDKKYSKSRQAGGYMAVYILNGKPLSALDWINLIKS